MHFLFLKTQHTHVEFVALDNFRGRIVHIVVSLVVLVPLETLKQEYSFTFTFISHLHWKKTLSNM